MKEKTDIDQKHEECEEIVKAHHSLEVVHMIAQSREMKKLVDNHR